jgi:hypothetical protein
MSLIFWIAVGLALAALIIGWVLRSRLSDDRVWEELVDPTTPQDAPQSQPLSNLDMPGGTNISRFSDQPPKPHWDVIMTPSPTAVPRPPRDADLRRSSRVERTVPLLVLATNRRGETFQEKTSAVAVNLHGCRYSSRHDYAPESWVTLQVTGTDGTNSSIVRARVRSVLSAQTPRELCQVGVELETPGNVWGIPAPPDDWHRVLGSSNSASGVATAVAPALDPSAPPPAFLEGQPTPPERRAEVTVFPGQPAAPAVVTGATPAEGSTAKDAAPSKPERVVVSSEQLLQALQGKLQLAADKAVQTSLSTQLDEAVKIALAKIEDGWRDNLRQTEEFSAARLAEVQNRWEKELVVYRGRGEEIARRLEALNANTQQALAETQRFVERFAAEIAPQLQARLYDSFAQANSEFEARVAEISGHQLAQLAESAQLAAREARSQLHEGIAEVHSLLATANAGASPEHLEALVNSSGKQTLDSVEERLGQFYVRSSQQYDLARDRADELARQLETLAAETRQTRSQHEQSLAEVRSLLANAKTDAGVPQERLDSLLNSSREQVLSHLEWRLGEVSAHYEQLLGQARGRAADLAQQVEIFFSDTRAQLAEIKDLVERTARKVQSQDIAAIQQSVGRATQEFETAAARVSDRQLVRLMELKQAISREVSLELEARTSEARAVLQKTANGTLEEIRRRVEDQIDLVLVEATERATSSLGSLHAESRAACEARYRSLEGEVARAAEQAALEFRSGIKAFLYSCLVAAVSAVDQHTQITLTGLANDPNSSPRALDAITGSSPRPEDPPAPPDNLSSSP